MDPAALCREREVSTVTHIQSRRPNEFDLSNQSPLVPLVLDLSDGHTKILRERGKPRWTISEDLGYGRLSLKMWPDVWYVMKLK